LHFETRNLTKMHSLYNMDKTCKLFSLCYGQVDSVEKIQKLLEVNAAELEDEDDFARWTSADFNCLLIEVFTQFLVLLYCKHIVLFDCAYIFVDVLL